MAQLLPQALPSWQVMQNANAVWIIKAVFFFHCGALPKWLSYYEHTEVPVFIQIKVAMFGHNLFLLHLIYVVK